MIAIAADHGGFDLKEEIKAHLDNLGLAYLDLGTHDTSSVDYPDYSKKVAHAILDGKATLGILICGSGVGISIGANRFKGIRAALVYNKECATLSRQHNDANVICFGSRIIDHKLALECVDLFLNTSYEGGRHDIRVHKLDEE